MKIEELVKIITPEELGFDMIQHAAGLMQGDTYPNHNREYLRGMVELIAETTPVFNHDDSDLRKQRIAQSVMMMAEMLPDVLTARHRGEADDEPR